MIMVDIKNKDRFLEKEWTGTFDKCFQLKYQKDQFGWKKPQTLFEPQIFDSSVTQDLQEHEQLGSIIAEFQRYKSELNDTKNLLNDYDIRTWRQHTSLTNKCGTIVKKLSTLLNPEFCTQAWIKFCTIIHRFELMELENEKYIKTAHLCEAPGAFIACLNHIIKCHYPKANWDWFATTLNPYFEGNRLGTMINDDRFIKETLEHWDFGIDFTGDLMNWDNVVQLMHRSESMDHMNLVTADGSIDCSNKPSEQELAVAPLLYWEILAAILILSPGGSLVLKAFTTFEAFTISLVYLLCCSFKEVYVFKPGPSKPGNSEVYIICKKYYGIKALDEDMIKILMSRKESLNPAETPLVELENIPLEFLDRLKNSSQFFTNHQINAIQRNIELFGNMTKGIRKRINQTRKYIAEEFVKRFQLSSLNNKDHLTSTAMKRNLGVTDVYDKEGNISFQSGSFSERMEKKKRTWNERVFGEGLQESENGSLHRLLSSPFNAPWYKTGVSKPPSQHEVDSWSTILGRKINQIRNSKFCSSVLMHELFEARENSVALEERNSVVLRSILNEILQQESIPNSFASQNTTNQHYIDEITLLDSTLIMFPNKEEVMVLQTRGITSQTYGDVDEWVEKIELLSEKKIYDHDAARNGKLYRYHRLLIDNMSQENNLSTIGASSIRTDCPDEAVLPRERSVSNDDSKCSISDRFETPSSSISSRADDDLWQCTDPAIGTHKYDIIIGPMFSEVLETGDIHSIFHVLFQLTVISNTLNHGGVYLCTIKDIFTYFDVGIMYVLTRLFDKICVLHRIVPETGKPLKLFVCQGFQGCPKHVVSYLKDVYRTLFETRSDGNNKDVLHLVPIKTILQEDFVIYMKQINEESASLEISLIKELERAYQSKKRASGCE